MALKSDGTVWTWGDNSFGKLGYEILKFPNRTNTPTQVEGLDNVVSIAAGESYSAALKKDGTVWTWGYSFMGVLGNGTEAKSTTPVHVGQLTDVVSIAAGRSLAAALKSDGTVWAWGYWGDGINTTPVQVKGPDGKGWLNLGQQQP